MTLMPLASQHGYIVPTYQEQRQEIERLKACLTGAATAFTELGYLGLSEAMIAARDGRAPANASLGQFLRAQRLHPGG